MLNLNDSYKTGAWKKKEYRAYDVKINVPSSTPGKPHFVNEAVDYIRQILLYYDILKRKDIDIAPGSTPAPREM